MGRQTPHIGGFPGPWLAARHWVVTTADLADAGWTKRRVESAVLRGVLHRVHHGVYAVGRPELSFEGRCRAAALACGPGAAVSHGPAGRLWGFAAWTGAIHVTGPRSLDGHPGVVVHRPRSFPPEDRVARDGVPVTSVARTLLDLAVGTPVERVGRWIHEAGVQRVFDPGDVWAVMERHPGHRGRRPLEAALALEVAPTRSGLERAFLPMVHAAGLPAALVNSRQWSGVAWEEVDFCWPALGLIVETDGARYHASRWRRRRDAEKQRRFEALGWRFRRVPELAITLDRAGVVGQLATLGRSKSPLR